MSDMPLTLQLIRGARNRGDVEIVLSLGGAYERSNATAEKHAEVLCYRAWALSQRGNHQEALTLAQQARNIISTQGDTALRLVEGLVMATVVAVMLTQGNHDTARSVQDEIDRRMPADPSPELLEIIGPARAAVMALA